MAIAAAAAPQPTPTLSTSEQVTQLKVTQLKAQALARWKVSRVGMVQIFYHITHSAGTTLCNLANDEMNHFSNVPPFACIGTPLLRTDEWIAHNTSFYAIETSLPLGNYGRGKKYKREVVKLPFGLPLAPDVMLLTCIRDPLLRLMSDLAKPGHTHTSTGHYELDPIKMEPDHKPGDVWEYNVRWLGGDTDEAALRVAIQRLGVFQVVMVVEWMDASAQLLCKVLGWANCAVASRTVGEMKTEYAHPHLGMGLGHTKGPVARCVAVVV
jgi:hypothetical protein